MITNKYFLILTLFVPYRGILFHYKTPFSLVKPKKIEYIVEEEGGCLVPSELKVQSLDRAFDIL